MGPGMGIMSGKRVASPYTVAEDENTKVFTPASSIAFNKFTVPPILTR